MGRTLTTYLGLLCAIVCAQTPRGSLRGTVKDPNGARINRATVLVRSPDSATERQAASEVRGEFRLDDLPPPAVIAFS